MEWEWLPDSCGRPNQGRNGNGEALHTDEVADCTIKDSSKAVSYRNDGSRMKEFRSAALLGLEDP